MREGSILVTGGAGYIGSHAVLALLDAGWRVVVIDNLSTGFPFLVDERATLVQGEIEDEARAGAPVSGRRASRPPRPPQPHQASRATPSSVCSHSPGASQRR